MDPNLVTTTSDQAFVSTAMNSVPNAAVASASSVIFLDSPIILPNDQPDILQQALAEVALTSSASVSTSPTIVPTKVPIQGNKEAKENFVTVFNSRDGTLRLTQENARALGIGISSNDVSVPTNVSAPGTAQVIIEKPMTAEPVVAGHSSKNVIIWPGNNPRAGGGNFAYFVRPQPMPTPVNVIRPSIQGQNTSLITNMLKPVMTTSIYDHHQKKIDMPRIPPAILPKPPPVVSVAPTMTLNNKGPVTSTSSPVFIVTSTIPAKINTASDPNLFGTTKYPIQLVQKDGEVFRTLQPLQSHQVTQIAKVLKQSRGVQDPSIVYEDKTSNRKLVYKIMSRDNARAVAKNASASSVVQPPVIHNPPPSSSESSGDGGDPEEIRKPLSAVSDVQVLHPHDVLKMTDPAILLNKKQRKRGRPTEFEQFFMPKPKNKHSKTLKAQFGLTEAQSQEVETDIVDDKSIVKVEVKDEISEVGIIDEDMMDEEGKVLSTSY